MSVRMPDRAGEGLVRSPEARGRGSRALTESEPCPPNKARGRLGVGRWGRLGARRCQLRWLWKEQFLSGCKRRI